MTQLKIHLCEINNITPLPNPQKIYIVHDPSPGPSNVGLSSSIINYAKSLLLDYSCDISQISPKYFTDFQPLDDDEILSDNNDSLDHLNPW